MQQRAPPNKQRRHQRAWRKMRMPRQHTQHQCEICDWRVANKSLESSRGPTTCAFPHLCFAEAARPGQRPDIIEPSPHDPAPRKQPAPWSCLSGCALCREAQHKKGVVRVQRDGNGAGSLCGCESAEAAHMQRDRGREKPRSRVLPDAKSSRMTLVSPEVPLTETMWSLASTSRSHGAS